MLLNEHFVDNNRNGDRELRLSMCLRRASDPAALAAAEAAPAARPLAVRPPLAARLPPPAPLLWGRCCMSAVAVTLGTVAGTEQAGRRTVKRAEAAPRARGLPGAPASVTSQGHRCETVPSP